MGYDMELSGHEYNVEFENYVSKNINLLQFMNNLLQQNEFTEEFLIKYREYYDSWKCLRNQSNLSPYFCFRYLYDTQEYDSADNWTDYDDVIRYLKNKYDPTFVQSEFSRAMKDRDDEEYESKSESEEEKIKN
jgi:hypothetical protein